MKLYKAIFISAALLFSTFADAAIKKFDITEVWSFANNLYYGLDLNGLEHITLTYDTDSSSGGPQIVRLDLEFPNAPNLVFKNFNLGEYSTFFSTVNDAWVFRKLIVELDLRADTPANGKEIGFRIYVAEKDFFKKEYVNTPEGDMLVDVQGRLVDITPNPVADTHRMKVDGKALSFKLYQNLEEIEYSSPGYPGGFKLDMNWLGHGARTVYLPSPVSSYDQYRAVALNVVIEPGTQGNIYMLEVEYEDDAFRKQTVNVGYLSDILREAYQL